jgi:allophanate hydrolase subunit 2
VLFLADHPVTGGYPVLAYVNDPEVDRCAQLRPGQRVSFRVSASAERTTPR